MGRHAEPAELINRPYRPPSPQRESLVRYFAARIDQRHCLGAA